MATEWFVKQVDGSVTGPFAERKVADDLLSGVIPTELQVRQGKDGPWCEASHVREIFQRLAEEGWYILATDKKEYGSVY